MDDGLDELRARLLRLFEVADAEGDPLRWFEELYDIADRNPEEVPWARMEPHPKMVEWIASNPDVQGRALVVGCGLGDDAEWLSSIGFDVTAFDISRSSIEWCRERFPDSSVEYRVADLLAPPPEWKGRFDIVIEIHILQAIPENIRDQAADNLPTLLGPDGNLLCIGRLFGSLLPDEPSPPWPLSKTWLEGRFNCMRPIGFTRFVYDDSPTVERYVAAWVR